LKEQTHGCEGVTRKPTETEADNDRWGIGIESTLRAIVAECDDEVHPETPVGELFIYISTTSPHHIVGD
jgi:hypothetical protein